MFNLKEIKSLLSLQGATLLTNLAAERPCSRGAGSRQSFAALSERQRGFFPRAFGVGEPGPAARPRRGELREEQRQRRAAGPARRGEEGGVLRFGSRDMKGGLVSGFPPRFITRQQDFHRGSSPRQDRFFRRTGSGEGSSSQHKQLSQP